MKELVASRTVRGSAAALLLFLVSGFVFISMGPSLSRQIPGLMPIYKVFLKDLTMPGTNLVFDGVALDILPVPEAEGRDREVYQITGKIINIGVQEVKIPKIKVEFWQGTESFGEFRYFEVEPETIKGENSIGFSSIVTAPEGEDVPTHVRLYFTVKGADT